jgi:hypothetical protein
MAKKSSGDAGREALKSMLAHIGEPDDHEDDAAERWHTTHAAMVKALPAVMKHLRGTTSTGTYDKGGPDSAGWDNGKGRVLGREGRI